MTLLLFACATGGAHARDNHRSPDLSDYEKLQIDEGHKVAYAAYAVGVQIYRWNGTSWGLVAPDAILFDWDGNPVGTHYVGPTWESASGSKVVGAVEERSTVDPTAIPWLKLRAVSSEGPGIFNAITYIHRVYTVGGLAPSEPGEEVGEEVRIPYAATYIFYRKHK